MSKKESGEERLRREMLGILSQLDRLTAKAGLRMEEGSNWPTNLGFGENQIAAADLFKTIREQIENLRSLIANENPDINILKYSINLILKFNYLPSWGTDGHSEYIYKKDLITSDATPLERLSFILTYSMRAILRGIDILVSQSTKDTFNATGETPFARSLTGNRQFFKNPMTTLSDTFNELKKVSDLLALEAYKRSWEPK